MAKWLMEEIGKEYLEREYVELRRSANKIAEELQTYPLYVIRALKRHGIPTRNRSEARIASLTIGDSVPSMLGRAQPEEVKQKISRGMARAAANRSKRGECGEKENADSGNSGEPAGRSDCSGHADAQ